MTRSIFVAVGLAVVAFGCGSEPKPACLDGQAAVAQAAVPDAEAGFHVYGHAHNDYEHARPLEDALEHRFYSVEADVWFDDGKLTVSHLGFGAKGNLRDLYLDPLQAKVDANGGSVHGDGKPFTLWVDLKENKDGFVDALQTLFGEYPMLTRIQDGVVTDGAVTIALTGDRTMKEAFAAAPDRRAFRDSNDYSPDDPAADSGWRFYALDWKKYLGWNGEGEIPSDDKDRLTCIIANAHEDGRKVRFYGAPDREEVWDAALDHGVDFVHTDKLAELDAFLDARQ